MAIGITERGDAAVLYGWTKKLNTVDGVILITKDLTDKFRSTVLNLYPTYPSIIVHATTTGWGFTIMEPHVPPYETQLAHLKDLIDKGFPRDHCVLRIDPIFPTEESLEKVKAVLNKALELGLLPAMRVRISILDEYPHVQQRFMLEGIHPHYDYAVTAPPAMIQQVKETLAAYPQITFETCAEPDLWGDNIVPCGCVGEKELAIFGLDIKDLMQGHQRPGCLCLSLKQELLTAKHPCKHQCLYCYWK